MSTRHRIKLRHRLLGGVYEFVWRIRGPKWVQTGTSPSLAASVDELRRTGAI